MIEALGAPAESPERKKQALNNLVVYAHQTGGRDILLKGGYIEKLIPMLSVNSQYCSALMKILHGFCENNYSVTLQLMNRVRTEQIMEWIIKYTSDIDHTTDSLSLIVVQLKAIVDHVFNANKLKPEDAHKNLYIRENNQKVSEILHEVPEFTRTLNILVSLLAEKRLTAIARDAVVDAFIKCIGYHKAVSDFILNNRGIRKLLELASLSCFPLAEKTSPYPINTDTYIHVSVALASIHEKIQYYEKDMDKFQEQAESIINEFIDSQKETSNLQGLVALSSMTLASREVGNLIANKNDIVSKLLIISTREDEIAQRLAAEALALAATDKTVCNTIATNGLDVLHALYESTDNDVRVRGLVTLCKVCMKGSGNIKDKVLADEGAKKLYGSCRAFLMSTKKDFEMRKWACEGLAYLTLDADVKELLVNDTEALNNLLELAKEGDSTVMYGICNTLVNLTNSYDKPEKNPEMEALAEYAKQPLPKMHAKDEEEFIKKRINVLMDRGLITALVNFIDIKSESTKEMLARIFHAVVSETTHRGKVVAQGGVKTLLPLAEKGTEKGINLASQALAKIGITSNPKLAFSGQRCMEVVRPFVKMLNFKNDSLIRFEGLMALTNLASMSDEVRRRIMKEKGFFAIEALMFDEEDEIKRAASECMCNLVLNDEAFNKYKEETDCERVKLVTLYCGEEPMELARAASGTLAILTSDVDICKKVAEVKSHLEIFKYLVSSDKPELRHRGLYIVANMLQADKDIAEKFIADELFEVLMALRVTNSTNGSDSTMTKELDRCFEAAQKWQLIEENPEVSDQ